jgi:Tfp pilus assembly protein PilF
VKLRADWVDAHMNLGLAQWKKGDEAAARKSFEKALAADPKSVDALRGLAVLAIQRQDFDQAFELQSKLIDFGQRSPELFYNTGLLLQKSGQYEDAVKQYRQALNEKPNIAEALLNLGHALKALGQEDEARSCWRKALESNPELAASYFSS